MAHTPTKPRYTTLAVSLAISAVVLMFGLYFHAGLKIPLIVSRLLWPLGRLLFFITVGLAVGQIIEISGWTRYLAVFARPFFRFGHLGSRCSAAFTTAFFSGTAANAMLMDFYQEGHITRRQLFLTNLVNQLPAFFLHLPTTFFIVIPLTGWAGGLYFIITFAAALLRTSCFLLYGHFKLPDPHTPQKTADKNPSPGPKIPKNSILGALRAKLPRRLSSIAVFVIPIYVMVFTLNAMGIFNWLRHLLATYVTTRFIPMESLSLVVLSFAAEFTSGFAAAGALLDAGMLTIQQTVLALLIGNIVAFPIRALRHQVPRYLGIFSPKMGSQLMLLGQGSRILSLILVGMLYYFVG